MEGKQYATSKFQNILKCSAELDQLAKSRTTNQRRKLIENAEDCLINAISELANNCLSGNFPLNKCQFKKLSKYKNILRKLKKKTKLLTRRKLLIQNGGFLPFLIPPALSFIASLIAEVIAKKL